MQKINEVAKSATQNIGKTSETSLKLRPEQRSRDLAKALFQKMVAIFPQKWSAQFPSEQIAALSMDEWAIGIRDLTDAQLAHGVDNVRRCCEWPPSIAEFREACLHIDDDWEHKSEAYKETRKALPAPLCKKEIADAEREKLRKLGISLKLVSQQK